MDASVGPYLTSVKGATKNATHYDGLLGHSLAPIPLWNKRHVSVLPLDALPSEQVISVSIDNTSIFIPDGDHDALDAIMEVGTTVLHFSVRPNDEIPLNYTHEYQIDYIEPSDGSHVFELQLGLPFTNPTGPLKVRDHALNELFVTPFTSGVWHNFAVQVDWYQRTLAVLYSENATPLKAVTRELSNNSTALGATGQGDFHIALLKLPLVNPSDTPTEQADVVHYGTQEGTTEGLL